MANRSAILSIRIVGDASKATQAIEKTQSKVSRFQSGLSKAAGGAALLLGGMAAMGKVAGDSASRLQQAQGAVESIFGKQASQIDNLAKKAAGATGLAQAEYSELAGVLGAQLSNLGVSQDELVGTTDGLISKGADLAATFGGTTADAVEALTAAFRGETDPIEKYGISIKQADVAAKMAADGTDKLTGAAGKAAKTQATLDLITKQSASSQGQFAREVDSAAGSAQIAAANWENAKASLGESLLPVMSALATKAAEVAGFIQQNSTAFTVLAGVVAGLAAAILVAQGASMAYSVVLGVQAAAAGAGTAAIAANSIALGAYAVWMGIVRTATLVWTGIQWALNAALSANPIALVVIAIAALVAGIIWAWNNVAWFRDGITAAWEWIKTTSITVFNAVSTFLVFIWTTTVNAVIAAVTWFVTGVVTAWNNVVTWTTNAFNKVKDFLVSVWTAIVTWVVTKIVQFGLKIINTWNKIKSDTTSVFNAVKTFIVNAFVKIVTTVIAKVLQIKNKITNTWENIKSTTRSAFAAIVSTVAQKIASVVSTVKALPGKIKAGLGNLKNLLLNSGKALMQGFADGISNGVSKAINAAKNVVSKVRDFFPFSPAKRGPFSGRGYTSHSGKALVGDFAKAMTREISSVRSAANRVATAGTFTAGYELNPSTSTRSNRDVGTRAPIQIIFNGVVTDKVGTAREIKRILSDYDLLVGATS